MKSAGHFTRNEIISQPEAWAEALRLVQSQADNLRNFYRAGQFDSVIFAGCGSTYCLALAAAALFQELSGMPARGLPASEVWLNSRSTYSARGRTLLVAISRSGETTETLRACEAFRANTPGAVLTLSCYPSRPLTTAGAVNLVLPSGQEESLAQTRAFTTLYVVANALAALWAGRDDLLDELGRLPEVCRPLIANYHSLARTLGTDATIDRFYFLGSGLRYGLACELSLKLKEMSLNHSEPFHFLEFRHGPKSMVTRNTLIVGLVSESNRPHEVGVLEDMRAIGARTFVFGEREADVVFASGLSEAARNVLYLPIGQLLAFERALHNDLDPDRPNNLDPVVKLNGV